MAAQAEYVSPARIFARSTTGAIWMGPKQQSVLDHLAGRSLLKVVLGPSSSGKSTVLRRFQETVQGAVALPISGPQKDALGVLATLLSAAGLGPWNLSEVEQRNLLSVFVQQRSLQGKRIVLCVDNVSTFTEEAWSEIERLRLLQFGNRYVVELVVVGTEADAARSPLAELLHESATSAIEAVHFLSAPSDQDVAGYVEWRLAQFGISNAFTDDACRLINCLTQGRYSFINILCQVVLMEHSREPTARVDAGVVRKAAGALAALKDSTSTADTVEIKPLDESALPRATVEGRIVVSCNGQVVRSIALNERILVGRSRDNDLFLPSRYLSRHHAAVLPTPDGHYHIVDLNSANGVLVNGKLVSRSVLYNGDVVRLGEFVLKLEIDETPAEAPAALDNVSLDDTDVVPMPAFQAPQVRVIKG